MTTAQAPVAVFGFNRPNHLRRTLESLKACEGFRDSLVYVFCDGPRTEADAVQVESTRAVAKEILGETAEYRFAPKNKGLAQSLTDGISELTKIYGRVIVVEDDLQLSPAFLSYMNLSLEHFKDDSEVMQVSGHMFNVPEFENRKSAMILPLTTTWGWATWHRAWSAYDAKATGWESLLHNRSLRKAFNLDGVYDYTTMMKRQMTGKIDSWGIRWHYAVFRQKGLGLFPPQSLVKNFGMDSSGTHGRGVFRNFAGGNSTLPRIGPTIPDGISVNEHDVAAVQAAIWRQNGGGLGWAMSRVKAHLGL